MKPRLKLEVCAFFVDEFQAALAAEERDDVEIAPTHGDCDERRRPAPTEASPASIEAPTLRLMCVCSGREACPNGHGKYTVPNGETCHARSPHPNLPPMPSPQSSPASGRGGERERQSSIPAGEGANESLCEFHSKSLHSCFELLLGPDKVDALLGKGAHLLTPAMVRAYPETLQNLNEKPENLHASFAESVLAWVVVDIGVAPLTAAEQAAFMDVTGGTIELLPTELHLLRANLRAALAQWEAAAIEARSAGKIASLQHRLADYTMAYDLIGSLIPHQGEQTIVHGILELFYMLCAPRAVHLLLVQNKGADSGAGVVEESVQLFSLPAASGKDDYVHAFLHSPVPWGEIEAPQGFYFQIRQGEQTMGVVVVEGVFLPEYQRYLDLAHLLMPILRLALHNARSYERLCSTERELRASQMELEQRVKERTVELEREQQKTEQLLHEVSAQQIELEMQNNELRQAQVAIEESRDRYVDLYDFAPIGYLTLTREASISEINLPGAALLGKERDRLIYYRFAHFVTPEDSDRWRRHFMNTLQHGDKQSCELMLQRDDGSRFHARLDCLRLISDGNVPAVRITLSDITKRKQVEAQSAKSLSLLYATLESTDDAILVVDLNSTWVLHNQRFVDLWHIPDEIIASGDDSAALSFVLDQLQDPDGFLNKVRELYATPEASSFDILEFKDGKTIERNSIPQRIDGKVVGRVWSFRDITGRKRAEAVLMRHKRVVDASIDGFWITDMRGNLLEANAAYAKISGYPMEELVNMHVSQLEAIELSPEDVHAHIAKVVAQGYDRFETRHRHKDGHEIDIEVSVTYMAELQQIAVFCRDITGRKQAEEALRIAAAAFETQDAIMITDAEGNIIRVNQAFSSITGYSHEEVMGKSMGMMNSGQDSQGSCIEILQQSIHDGSWAGEIYDTRKNGQVYPKWMTVTAIKNERQEITHYVSIFSDITVRKQMGEARLRESEERFRGTLEQAAVGIAHATLDGYFRQVNQKFCDIVGYARDELIHMSFHEITFPADLDENVRYIRQLLAGEIATFSMEKRYVRKDRSLVWVNLTVSLLRDADGTPKYTIGVIEDITERKQSEALAEQFGGLLQNSFDEIYIFNARSLHFLMTSEGAEKNLGYSSDELNRLTPLNLKPLFSRESFEQLVAPLRSGEQQSLFFETMHRRKDGTTYPVEVRLQLMQGEYPVFMAIIQDITGRQQAERDLLESHEQLRGLSAHLQTVREEERVTIAREVHDELGQTLTALRLKIAMLRMQHGANDPVLAEQVPGMMQLVDRAIQGVRDVAASLRPPALDMGIVPALEWLSNDFAAHGGITCTLHGAGIEIELDELRAVAVFRVVQEALTNVARHAEASRVEIVLKQVNGGIKVMVRDNGRGFYPSAFAHKKTFGLLGMRERALALGGEVEINSTPGHGTEISIFLPPPPPQQTDEVKHNDTFGNY